ncbi:MAG: PAS domain S-box protein [Acaryochloridaceae cyanobacterium SU_2_1]|nr:PAS domain S-box protein [Acaryochloridaceae cyanobacterium SU_2_1]
MTWGDQSYYYDTIYTPITTNSGEISQIWLIGRDITAKTRLQRQREARLEEQTVQIQERFRTSFHYAAVAKALVALDGSWMQVNSSLCHLLGYSQALLLTKQPADLIHPDDLEIDQSQIDRLLQGFIASYQVEKRYFHQLGHVIPVLLSVALVHDSRGCPSYLIAEMQDLSQRKKAEAALHLQLEETLKLQDILKTKNETLKAASQAAEAASLAKSEFLAMMSHEIRTPMNAVIGMTDLLLETSLNPQQVDFVATIQASGETLLMIINDILDFSKIESGKLELETLSFEIAPLLEKALDIIAPRAAAKGLTLAYFIEPGIPESIQGDPNRLQQILINLLSNAVKFTEQGEVVVTLTNGQPSTSTEQPSGGAQLLFAIQDTGIGIAPEKQHLLFKSFSQVDSSITRQYGGTGLGLAISKRLCTMMGGYYLGQEPDGERIDLFLCYPSQGYPSPGPIPGQLTHLGRKTDFNCRGQCHLLSFFMLPNSSLGHGSHGRYL